MRVEEGEVAVRTRIGQRVARGAAVLLGLATWGFTIFLMRDFDPIHGPSAARVDARALWEMSRDCADAAALGRLAMEKAMHEELRRFGGDQVSSSSREIGRLNAWLRERHGLSIQAGAEERNDTALGRLMPLAGAEFEAAFLDEFLRRNTLALQRAERCRRQTGDADLQRLCERVIAGLRARQEHLEGWRSRWYSPRGTSPP